MGKEMYVVLSRGGDGSSVKVFGKLSEASRYADGDAWEELDGFVDEVEIHAVATDDIRIARDRVVAGNSQLIRRVKWERPTDRREREDKAAAIKLLASIGLGDTSLKKG